MQLHRKRRRAESPRPRNRLRDESGQSVVAARRTEACTRSASFAKRERPTAPSSAGNKLPELHDPGLQRHSRRQSRTRYIEVRQRTPEFYPGTSPWDS